MNRILDIFKKYGAFMASQDYPVGEHAGMMLRTDDGVFATTYGCNLKDLKEDQIQWLDEEPLGAFAGEMKAAVWSRTPYCMECLRDLRDFSASLDDMAQIIGPRVKVANGTLGEKNLAKELRNAMRTCVGCLVLTGFDEEGKGRGYTLTMGRTLYEAVVAMTVLEKSCEVTVLADRIGGAKPLPFAEALLMRQIYKRKYSKAEDKFKEEESVSVQTEKTAETDTSSWLPGEAELRQELADYGRKLVETGLVQGTWGNISVRLDDRYMLVTPSGLDYLRLGPEDMVRVEIETLKYKGSIKPTSEKGLHAEFYKRRPDVGAVIHTHSKYLSVFAAAEEDMPVLEKYQDVFGTNVALAGYGLPGSKKLMTNTADALGENYGVIMSHHGMAACGKDLETAFENCRKLEENGKEFLRA